MPSKIEWTEETWNPVTGCTKISPGCAHCYAERMAHRLAGRYGYPDAPHKFDVTLHPDRLEQPLHWKKPRRVFVCSMSDLFHEDVPFEFVNKMFEVMEQSSQHAFQVLTKRPERMLEYVEWWQEMEGCQFDVKNVWLGVTAEDQQRANERIPILLDVPAAVRFVSIEPMLGQVNLDGWRGEVLGWESLDWVICGGESGPGARPMCPDWVRSLRDQCQYAGVPFFFKQWGAWQPIRAPLPNGFKISDCNVREWHCGFAGATSERFSILVGKKRAGRLLDGREWNQYPEVQS